MGRMESPRLVETMMRHAQFEVVESTSDRLVIRDLGPWSKYPTITNDAEFVVEYVVAHMNLNGRRLLYIDSEQNTDELVVDAQGQFAGFRPVSILKGERQ